MDSPRVGTGLDLPEKFPGRPDQGRKSTTDSNCWVTVKTNLSLKLYFIICQGSNAELQVLIIEELLTIITLKHILF